jgi:hypothetical protein
MKPQEILMRLYAAGGRIDLDPEQPGLLVPDQVRPMIETHRELLRASVDLPEVARRARLFRDQIDNWARAGRIAVPTVTVSEVVSQCPGTCVSCGAHLDHGNWRCPTCVAALFEALRREER